MGSAGSKETQRARKFKQRLEREGDEWIEEQRYRIRAGIPDPDYSDINVLLPKQFTKHKTIDIATLELIGKRGPQGVYTWPAPKMGMLIPLATIWDDATRSVVKAESGEVIGLERLFESTEEDPADILSGVNWDTLTNRIEGRLHKANGASGVSRFAAWRSTLSDILEHATEDPKKSKNEQKMYLAYFDTAKSTAAAMVEHIQRIFFAAALLVRHSRHRSQVPSGYANRLSIGP
jgi:hypothetical protein